MLGVLTLVPYAYWKKTHAMHHATSGDLSRRGFGDVRTLTVREYRALSRGRRLAYRTLRNPFALLVVGPFYLSQALGLTVGADLVTVERTWRRLVLKNHPDRFAGDPAAERAANERLRRINEAHEDVVRWLRDHERA